MSRTGRVEDATPQQPRPRPINTKRRTSMVTMKDIQSIRENLKKCKPADLANSSDKPLSNREAVKQLASTLLKMRKRGFTIIALVELLQAHQINIKGSDLSRYLRAFQGEKPTKVKSAQSESALGKSADLPADR